MMINMLLSRDLVVAYASFQRFLDTHRLGIIRQFRKCRFSRIFRYQLASMRYAADNVLGYPEALPEIELRHSAG